MSESASALRMKVENIGVRFGGTIALGDVDLDVHPGEVLALIGENGAGKSTLMKVLSGAVRPQTGKMLLDGQPYSPQNPKEARARGVAMIYQELALAPSLTVRENIFLGMEPTRNLLLDKKQMTERATTALLELGHKVDIDSRVSTLSISDQQLVEIARASAASASVLILDEPTSSITNKDVEKLFALIRKLKAKGQSIIYISHFLEELKEIAERFVVLRDGKSVATGMMKDVSKDDIVAKMIGRSLDSLYPRSPHAPAETIVTIDSLSGFTKLKEASLTLRRGEVLGIFGLIGSGRTELLRAIFGLDAVQSGDLKVALYQGKFSPAKRWEQGMGMVSEDRKGEGLLTGLSIAQNLILPVGMKETATYLSPAKVEATTKKWIQNLAIKCQSPAQKIGDLSGGNQQKVALARLLNNGVDVLLLDEPTRGIDVGSKRQIYELVDKLALENKAVLIISSYIPELLGTCDRIAVMSRGRLSKARDVADTNELEIMAEAIEVDLGDK
ncbi:MAG: sugar ABC transporter ATP-binding protein [Cyanobacteria bacterium REEB67]|nr:sugar ABC transporter ATP-binding protein [Cyanobacteria bacterium REEB67]